MDKLGEYLRARREEKGLTLKDMADRTRISLSFLQALEEGNYQAIPGEVFISGFLRSYARELGLKEKEVMALYRDARPAEQPDTPISVPDVQPSREKGRGRKTHWIAYAAAAVLAALIIGYFITSDYTAGPERQTLPPAVSDVPHQAAGEPAETPMHNMTSAEKTAAQQETEQETTAPAPAATATGPVTIRIMARAETWYSAKLDGSIRTSGLLRPDEEARLVAERDILLDVGNAGGAEIEFMGKIYGPFGQPDAVKRNIYFSADSPGFTIKKPQPPAAPQQGETP